MNVLDTKPISTDPKALYINLLLRAVTNMIYRDPPMAGPVRGDFNAEARINGLDWPLVAHTMVGVKRLENLRALCEQVIKDGIPGNFIETGV